MSAYLVQAGSAVDMWWKLEKVFAASSSARVMDLRLQLQTFKKGYLNIEDYALKIKMIADHLAAIGYPVPNQGFVFQVLGGLEANWNSFISGITLRLGLFSFEIDNWKLEIETIIKRTLQFL